MSDIWCGKNELIGNLEWMSVVVLSNLTVATQHKKQRMSGRQTAVSPSLVNIQQHRGMTDTWLRRTICDDISIQGGLVQVL